VLEKRAIRYEWINIDRDEQAENFVLSHNGGMRSVPTVVFPDGSIMVEPKFSALVEKLEALGLTAQG
jgi:mycoredoxin